MRPFLLVLCCALFLCCASDARADNAATDPGAPFHGTIGMPRSLAMGGADAAIATSNDAIVTNPAGLAQTQRYHLEVDGAADNRFPAQGVMASIVDSKSAPVASGILFSRWGSGQPSGRAEGWLLGLAYAYPAGAFFVGGETKYLRFHTQDGLVQKVAQDIGLLARRGSLSYAAVVQNISFNALGPLFPLTTTAAVAWGSDTDWHLALDYKADLSDTSHIKSKFDGGLEYLFDQAFALRVGGTYDPTNKQAYFSAGIGILAEIGGVQLAFRRRIEGGFDQVLEAGLTLYLE
jgi:hypothetical protein